MSERNDGGPAFPREDYQTDNAPGQEGMTLRDYFAAKAMQALLHTSAEASFRRADKGVVDDFASKRTVCHAAYRYADAMLAEREK